MPFVQHQAATTNDDRTIGELYYYYYFDLYVSGGVFLKVWSLNAGQWRSEAETCQHIIYMWYVWYVC